MEFNVPIYLGKEYLTDIKLVVAFTSDREYEIYQKHEFISLNLRIKEKIDEKLKELVKKLQAVIGWDPSPNLKWYQYKIQIVEIKDNIVKWDVEI